MRIAVFVLAGTAADFRRLSRKVGWIGHGWRFLKWRQIGGVVNGRAAIQNSPAGVARFLIERFGQSFLPSRRLISFRERNLLARRKALSKLPHSFGGMRVPHLG